MHITILAYGTQGDVRPYVALGAGLRRAGHTVRLASPRCFQRLVMQCDLEYAPLAGDPTELMEMAVARSGSSNPLGAAHALLQHALPLAAQMMRDVEAACRGTDAIVHSLFLTAAGREQALRLGVPDISALIFAVFHPTGAFPNPGFPRWPLGSTYNRLTHVVFNRAFWTGGRLAYAYVRRRAADLPPLEAPWPFGGRAGGRTPVIYGFSERVIPRAPEWGQNVHITGYWLLDSPPGWRPSQRLISFLEQGAPPVCVTFGSVIAPDASELTRTVVAALERTQQRAVMVSGWGGLSSVGLPDSTCCIEAAPFDWLFPRVSAIVHHGGAGTTAEAFRAGVPSVIVPFTADQPFWGWQVHRLGVGPPPIPRRRLTPDGLAEALHTATSDVGMRRRAAELGGQLRSEDGVARAVEIIERYLADGCARAIHNRA